MKTMKRIEIMLAMMLVLLAWSGVAQCGNIFDAAKADDVATIKTLLAGNPDLVNTKDTIGNTPLNWAVYWGKKKVAKVLLAHGADVNAKNN